jgi:hypothetical protein
MPDNRPTQTAPMPGMNSAQFITIPQRAHDYKDIYSNNCRVGVSPWDFTVAFALAKESINGMMVAEDQSAVRMSPQQFKTFCKSIKVALEAWEHVFGEIAETSPTTDSEKMKTSLQDMKDAMYKQAKESSSAS